MNKDFNLIIENYLKSKEKNKNVVLKPFKEICEEINFSPLDKFNAIERLIQIEDFHQDCLEMLWKWRDIIPFLKGYDLEDIIDLLSRIAKSSVFSSHERIITATCLYNNAYIDLCYDCFHRIACDNTVETMYRVEATKFLFSTDNDDYKQIAQEVIIEIIEDYENTPSDKRYKVITEFISRSGIKSFLNKSKLRIPYDENFVYGLQVIFFHNTNNGMRERILSGQHLLQMNLSNEKDKLEIEECLLDISQNKTYDKDTRADAADVVLRNSKSDDLKLKARTIIGNIGFEDLSGDLLSRTPTIYTNSQNVHDFTDQVNSFIEKLIVDGLNISIKEFGNIQNNVLDYSRMIISDRSKRFQIMKALYRISIDTATFTKFNATLSEIFVLVWLRIENRIDTNSIEELKLRLLDELIDMGDTCSSGHINRIINVLSYYDKDINFRVEWKDQIISNVVGRLNAKIRDTKNEDIKYSLIVAKTDLAEEKDKVIYNKFLSDELPLIQKELYKEFVLEGHVHEDEFIESFEQSKLLF